MYYNTLDTTVLCIGKYKNVNLSNQSAIYIVSNIK